MGMGSFQINVEKLKTMSLSKTTVGAWATSTKGKEQLLVVQLVNMDVDKKLFVHSLDLTVLNSYIILPSCKGKISHITLCWK
jgi:hypothetical protein